MLRSPPNAYAQTSGAAGLTPVLILGKSAVAASCPADTTEDILATITVPANAMGINGQIRVTVSFSYTNSGNTNYSC